MGQSPNRELQQRLFDVAGPESSHGLTVSLQGTPAPCQMLGIWGLPGDRRPRISVTLRDVKLRNPAGRSSLKLGCILSAAFGTCFTLLWEVSSHVFPIKVAGKEATAFLLTREFDDRRAACRVAFADQQNQLS